VLVISTGQALILAINIQKEWKQSEERVGSSREAVYSPSSDSSLSDYLDGTVPDRLAVRPTPATT
jgi:hypothetical protein